MFSGIVRHTGRVTALDKHGGDLRLAVRVDDAPALPALGDSVAINGACLSVVEARADCWCFDVSAHTLSCTLFGEYESGRRVNIETALRLGDVVGGHLVSGHVDGIATVSATAAAGRCRVTAFRVPRALAAFIAVKGSVCMDGVSLTVNAVDDTEARADTEAQADTDTGAGVGATVFEVNIVPHTLQATVCGEYHEGTRVHIEVDLVARYLARLLATSSANDKR